MLLIRPLILLLLLSLPRLAASQLAADQDPVERGGRFLARTDSLGYDEYRKLAGQNQLDRREEANRWVRQGNNSVGPDPDAFATAVGLCPYLPQGWLGYAFEMHEQGLYRDALTCLRHARRTLKYELRDERRRELTGDVHGLHASVAYNTGDFQASLTAVESALEIHPGRGQLRLLYARVLSEFDRFDEATRILYNFAPSDPEYAHALAALGVLHLRLGLLDRADDAFKRAYKYGMRGAVFENDRGRLCIADDRYEDAIGHFRAAIERVPTFWEARSNLGVAFRRMGRLAEAQAELLECLEGAPSYAPGHFNLAEVYREQAQGADEAERSRLVELAMASYSDAVTHGYDPAVALQRQATLTVLGADLDTAERSLLSLADDPDVDGRVLYLLGRVKKEQGDYQIAANLFSMAVDRGYDGSDLHSDYGEVLLRSGDLEDAREHLTLAIRANPELVVTRVNLSVVLSRLGRLEEADEVLREAEAREPGSELVKTQRAALRLMGVDR